MVRDTLLGFPSHSLPYRYRKSCHFIDSLRLSHKRWLSPIINNLPLSYKSVRRGDPRGRPPIPYRTPGKAHVPCPTKMYGCRAGPMCPAAPALLVNGVIARPVRKLVVAIRIPVPSAPLPKEGWHGEAVTGDSFPAPLVTDAGRCGHRPLRNPIGKPSVAADASVRPLRLTARSYNRSGPWPYRSACTPPQIPRR